MAGRYGGRDDQAPPPAEDQDSRTVEQVNRRPQVSGFSRYRASTLLRLCLFSPVHLLLCSPALLRAFGPQSGHRDFRFAALAGACGVNP